MSITLHKPNYKPAQAPKPLRIKARVCLCTTATPQNINTVGFTTELGQLDRVASLAWQCLGQRLEMEIPVADLHVVLFFILPCRARLYVL